MIVTRSDSKKRLLEESADSDICENTNPKQSKLESTSGHVINSDVINGGVISVDVINCDVIDGGEGSLSPTDCSELQGSGENSNQTVTNEIVETEKAAEIEVSEESSNVKGDEIISSGLPSGDENLIETDADINSTTFGEGVEQESDVIVEKVEKEETEKIEENKKNNKTETAEDVKEEKTMAEKLAATAVAESEVRKSPQDYYYHYTTTYATSEIQKDQYLKQSTPHYKANIGEGIYVTTLDPFTNTRLHLRNVLFLGGSSPITKSKLDCYFALKKNDVMTACSLVQQYPRRPKCFRLVPQNGKLYLSKTSHYSGPTNLTGDESDSDSDRYSDGAYYISDSDYSF